MAMKLYQSYAKLNQDFELLSRNGGEITPGWHKMTPEIKTLSIDDGKMRAARGQNDSKKPTIKSGAEVGQNWGSFWTEKLAGRLPIPSGRWHAHGHTGRYADMPRHAMGRKLHQFALNCITNKTAQRLDKSWMKIGQEKIASSCHHLILPTISFMCCVARGLL